jgi:hypothetical protein
MAVTQIADLVVDSKCLSGLRGSLRVSQKRSFPCQRKPRFGLPSFSVAAPRLGAEVGPGDEVVTITER